MQWSYKVVSTHSCNYPIRDRVAVQVTVSGPNQSILKTNEEKQEIKGKQRSEEVECISFHLIFISLGVKNNLSVTVFEK